MLVNLKDFEKTVNETVALLKEMDEERSYSIKKIEADRDIFIEVTRTSKYSDDEAVISEHIPNTYGVDEMLYFMDKYIANNPYSAWLNGSSCSGTIGATIIKENMLLSVKEDMIDFNLQRLNKFFEIIKWQKEN